MKKIQKYFLAIVPPEPIFSKSEEIKKEIKQKFNLKYALKSPSHITLKMPFSFNEAKEDYLSLRVSKFLEDQKNFTVKISGIGSFSRRVIFQQVITNQSLTSFQLDIKNFCKRELHLVEELSDRNYHPHLTLAFKDLTPLKFEGVINLCNELQFEAEFVVDRLYLVKRTEGQWLIHKSITFGNKA